MLSLLKKLILISGVLLVLATATAGGYCWYLSGHIEERFAGRKWDIPSTIYSDTTPLFPGKQIDLFAFEKKIKEPGIPENNRPA